MNADPRDLALDHRSTVDALIRAFPQMDAVIPPVARDAIAESIATALGQLGFAIVPLTDPSRLAHDLSDQVNGFLSRSED